MLRGEGVEVVKGVTPEEVFDFVLDPAQYTKADTKIVWVTKLADAGDGMIGREDGRFLGLSFLRGSVITRYRWRRPSHIDVTLVHGPARHVHAWFEIERVPEGTRVRHVEELGLRGGPVARLLEAAAAGWFARSVAQEVAEIKRLLEAGERGRGPA